MEKKEYMNIEMEPVIDLIWTVEEDLGEEPIGPAQVIARCGPCSQHLLSGKAC